MAGPRNASLRAAALSRITAGSVSRERARWKRERRNRVPDRSPRRSIVGQAIKGTLIVASDEQWRHRNYRYTPDTLFGPLDTYSLSLFPPSSSLVSFALFACVYHPSCTHGAVLVVCTLVKHRWQQACERILRVTTLVRAPLSATLLVECRDGVDTCSVQTIHPLPLPLPPPSVREPRTERILAAGDTGIWASSELQRLVQAWNFVDRGFIRSRSFVVVVVPLCLKR